MESRLKAAGPDAACGKKARILARIVANYHETARIEGLSRAELGVHISNEMNARTVYEDGAYRLADEEERGFMLGRSMDESGYIRIFFEDYPKRKAALFAQELAAFAERYGEAQLCKLGALFPESRMFSPELMHGALASDEGALSDIEGLCRSAPVHFSKIGTLMRYLNSFESAQELERFVEMLGGEWARIPGSNAPSRCVRLSQEISGGTVDEFVSAVADAAERRKAENRKKELQAENEERRRQALRDFLQEIRNDAGMEEAFRLIDDNGVSADRSFSCVPEELKALLRQDGLKDRLAGYGEKAASLCGDRKRKGIIEKNRRVLGSLTGQFYLTVCVKDYFEGKASRDELLEKMAKFDAANIGIDTDTVRCEWGKISITTYKERLLQRLKYLHEELVKVRLRLVINLKSLTGASNGNA